MALRLDEYDRQFDGVWSEVRQELLNRGGEEQLDGTWVQPEGESSTSEPLGENLGAHGPSLVPLRVDPDSLHRPLHPRGVCSATRSEWVEPSQRIDAPLLQTRLTGLVASSTLTCQPLGGGLRVCRACLCEDRVRVVCAPLITDSVPIHREGWRSRNIDVVNVGVSAVRDRFRSRSTVERSGDLFEAFLLVQRVIEFGVADLHPDQFAGVAFMWHRPVLRELHRITLPTPGPVGSADRRHFLAVDAPVSSSRRGCMGAWRQTPSRSSLWDGTEAWRAGHR